MKSLILICWLLSFNITLVAQEENNMFCFASALDLNGVTLISEIYEISTLEKEEDRNSFKIKNTNSFFKIIISMGHEFAVNTKTKGIINMMIISKDWQEITRLYDDIKKKSNGKLIVIDRENFSILYPEKKEILIRE
jgi:hypothetical protein